MSLYLKESSALRMPTDSAHSMDLKPPSMALQSQLLMAGAPGVGPFSPLPMSPSASGLGALSWAAAALSSVGLLGPPSSLPTSPLSHSLSLPLPPIPPPVCPLSQHSPGHRHQQYGPQFGSSFGTSYSFSGPYPNDTFPPPFEPFLEALAQLRHCAPPPLPASPVTPSVLANARPSGGDAQFLWPPHVADQMVAASASAHHQLDTAAIEDRDKPEAPVSGLKRKGCPGVERTGDSKSVKHVSKFDIESLLPAASDATSSEASENVAQQQLQQPQAQQSQQQPALLTPTSLATPLPCALQQLLSHWFQQQSQAQMCPSAEAERAISSQPQAQLSPVSNSGSATDSSSWCSTRSSDALCRELNVERAAAGRRTLHEFSPVVNLLVKLSSAQARLCPDNGEA